MDLTCICDPHPYSARAQDGPQEMERYKAAANHVACPSCAWLLLSFFPYPVGHPEHGHCTPFKRNALY